MLLTDKYADKMNGIITCYDRMIDHPGLYPRMELCGRYDQLFKSQQHPYF